MTDKNLRIGYFGIPGSFTYGAAIKYFGSGVDLEGAKTFKEVFLLVKEGVADYGVVPIENTLAGSVYENYDLLDKYDLSIVGETSCRIEHSLLASGVHRSKHVDIKTIKTVYSHPKALEQCSVFFEKHPWIEKISHSDTATAAKFVAEQQDNSMAAIASRQNAQIYGLEVLEGGIQDNVYNYTRFLVIAPNDPALVEGANKCSLIVRLRHSAGSLSQALNFLTHKGCNLTKIESRPIPNKPFEYMFYLDFLFDVAITDVVTVLDEFQEHVSDLKVLGLYQDERAQNDQETFK